MKNASLVLNVVLLVAVVVLYFLHFSSGKPASSVSGGGSAADIKVAYINEDTVLKYYDFFKVNREKLEAKAKQLEQQFTARQSSLQREVQSFQATANNLTIGQARALEADLQQKGQNLQMYQQSLSQEMMQEESKVGEQIYDKVTAYLKQYSQEKGYAVILKYNRGSDVLYAGDSLNVTKDVIAGLNEAWKAESQTVPAKKDSVK
jgi:outer membrane protein